MILNMNGIEYIDAQEAVKRIKIAKEKRFNKELDHVYTCINQAINNEQYFVEVDYGTDQISNEIIQYLTKKGFIVMPHTENLINGDICNKLCIKFIEDKK